MNQAKIKVLNDQLYFLKMLMGSKDAAVAAAAAEEHALCAARLSEAMQEQQQHPQAA